MADRTLVGCCRLILDSCYDFWSVRVASVQSRLITKPATLTVSQRNHREHDRDENIAGQGRNCQKVHQKVQRVGIIIWKDMNLQFRAENDLRYTGSLIERYMGLIRLIIFVIGT